MCLGHAAGRNTGGQRKNHYYYRCRAASGFGQPTAIILHHRGNLSVPVDWEPWDMGFRAAVGAQIACPDNLVIAVTGDGSFQMCMHELGTILEQELPIKILVFNNNVLGMVRQLQYHYSGQRYSGVHFSKTVNFRTWPKLTAQPAIRL